MLIVDRSTKSIILIQKEVCIVATENNFKLCKFNAYADITYHVSVELFIIVDANLEYRNSTRVIQLMELVFNKINLH